LKQKREQKSVKPKILGSELNELETNLERDERDIDELQRRDQEELANLELSSFLKLEYKEIDVDQNVSKVQAQNYSIDAIQKDNTQVSVSTPKDENSPTQEHEPQQNRAQVKGQEKRLTKEAHETKVQERSQEHEVQERGHEHQKQENEQEDKAHENEVHENGFHENEAYKDAAHNDKIQGDRQANEAQEIVQKNKAYKKGQDNDAYKNDVREYRARKRRMITKENDDNAALRTQQVREERKLVKKSKYQRLNRFDSSNHNINLEDDTSMNNARERNFTLMQRKKPQTSR